MRGIYLNNLFIDLIPTAVKKTDIADVPRCRTKAFKKIFIYILPCCVTTEFL